MGGPKKPPAIMHSRVEAAIHTSFHAHAVEVHFLSVYFFSVYTCSLLGAFGAFRTTLWRPMGQSSAKIKIFLT